MESINAEPQEPLLHDQTETSSKLKQEAAPQSPFHAGAERPYRDSTFTFLFLAAILTTFTVGIIASTRTDTLDMGTKLRLSSYNPTTNKCEITQQQTQQTPKASDSNPYSDPFVKRVALFYLAVTIPGSLLLVFLLHRVTQTMVVLSAPAKSLLFLGLGLSGCLLGGLLWFSRCVGVPEEWGELDRIKSIFDLLLLSSILALSGYLYWGNSTGSSVEDGDEVLRVATGFLKEHFVLLVVNPVLLLGTMVLVNGPILTFMWYAFNVGEIVPNFDVVNDPIKGCGLGTGIRCCRAERPGWVYAYITFASFTSFWVFTVSMVLQYSVVNGTVSLWYFARTDSSAMDNIKRALGNAYGPSFGTTCNLGTIVTTLVVASVRFLKKMLSDKVLQSNNQGMILSFLQGCFSWMSQFPEHYPQLPSIFLGIWESSKKSSQLNFLQQASPISTSITNFKDLATDALWGVIVIRSFFEIFKVHLQLEYFSEAFGLFAIPHCVHAIIIGLETGFFLTAFSAMKSMSICRAMERDIEEIYKPEGCHAFMTNTPSLLEINGVQVVEAQD